MSRGRKCQAENGSFVEANGPETQHGAKDQEQHPEGAWEIAGPHSYRHAHRIVRESTSAAAPKDMNNSPAQKSLEVAYSTHDGSWERVAVARGLWTVPGRHPGRHAATHRAPGTGPEFTPRRPHACPHR